MSTLTAWPRPWGVTRRPRSAPPARQAPPAVAPPPLPLAAALPDDEHLVRELAARCLATALVRNYAGARDLSDLFAAARVALPLLNWPTSALQPLEQLVGAAR